MKYSVKDLQKQLKEFRDKLDTEQAQMSDKPSKKQTELFDHFSWLISTIDQINDYEKDLSAEGFPFDLTYLAWYHRCQQVYTSLDRLLATMQKTGKLKEIDLKAIGVVPLI